MLFGVLRDRTRGVIKAPQPATKRNSEATRLEERLLTVLPALMRRLLREARQQPAWFDLGFQHYTLLRMIEVEGALPQKKVARRLMVSSPVVTRMTATLVRAGLVQRQGDPRDLRAVILTLTPSGKRRVVRMRTTMLAATRDLMRSSLAGESRGALAFAIRQLESLLADVSAE